MIHLIDDVRDFHRVHGVPIAQTPEFPEFQRIKLRASLIREECNKELLPALERAALFSAKGFSNTDDMLAIADGIVDSIYVHVGCAIEFGIPLDRVWAEVHAANMRKIGGPKRPDGKILKPPGWKPPDIARALWGDR